MGKNILILRDGRTGNFRQAQAVAEIACRWYGNRHISSSTDVQEVKFRGGRVGRMMLTLHCAVAGKWRGGSRWLLRTCLQKDVYSSLMQKRPDVVITGGSSVAPVNAAFSAVRRARSIAVMKPAMLGPGAFDLLVIPRHDNPPKRGNIVVTEGALNLIDREYLETRAREAVISSPDRHRAGFPAIGMLIGGDMKDFSLGADTVREAVRQVRAAARELDRQILATTSRRTPSPAQECVKRELESDPRCMLCVIANEKNIPGAVDTILCLCRAAVISPESVMMISEAVSSGAETVVFDDPGVRGRHRRFLEHFASRGYIRLVPPGELARAIRDIRWDIPRRDTPLRDRTVVAEALGRIL